MASLFLAIAIAGQAQVRYWLMHKSAAVGIIGGADGPTSIIMINPAATNDYMLGFVGSVPLLVIGLITLLIAAVAAGILVYKKRKK